MSLTSEHIHEALTLVADRDDDVRRGLEDVGLPQPRIREPGFPSLLSIMVSQQLSVKAAATIHGRLENLLRETTPKALLDQSDEALRTAGLSRQKVGYGRALAEACTSNTLDFSAIGRMNDDEAIKVISSVKGFGRWSAEIYLMFCEGRPDIWPSADLGLQAGLHHLKGLPARPTAKETVAHVEPWRPHRSAMSLFLWHYYSKTAAPA